MPTVIDHRDNPLTLEFHSEDGAQHAAARFTKNEDHDNAAVVRGKRVTFFGQRFKRRALQEYGSP